MGTDLIRLTYISQFAGDFGADDLRQLVEQSAKNNAELGITGVLMATGGVFYQVLEGPPDVLESLYARIEADERHKDVLLLGRVDIGERLFGAWSMRAISADEMAELRLAPVLEKLESVLEQQRQVELATRSLHRQVWKELDRIVRTGDTQVGLRDGVVAAIG